MQHDELIWQVIGHHHCSYRADVAEKAAFCRNEFNVTGMCNRTSCPLANSRYSTIREEKGRCFLYMKTIERAHMPNKMWEKVQLSRNYAKALAQITEHLAFWPKYLVHKCKQRLTKIVQYLIRIRKIEKEEQPALERVHKKVDRREAKRESKALRAAEIEKAVQAELLDRLKAGTYGDIYNFPEVSFAKALDQAEAANDKAKAAAEDEEELESEEEDELIENMPSDMHLLRKGGKGAGAAKGGAGAGDDDDDEEEYEDEEEEEGVEYVEDEELDAEYEAAMAAGAGGGDLEDYGASGDDDDDDDDGAGAGSSAGRKAGTGVGSKRSRADAAAAGGAGAAAAGRTAKKPRAAGRKVDLEYEVEEEEAPRARAVAAGRAGGAGAGAGARGKGRR